MSIAESLYELDKDGNTNLAFLTALNMIVETGSGSDMSQITGHGSDGDKTLLITITKISIQVSSELRPRPVNVKMIEMTN